MNLSQLQKNYINKYDHMNDQVSIILNFIIQKIDFVLLGAQGIGKTNFINQIFNLLPKNIKQIKINCVQCAFKSEIIKKISIDLNNIFDINIKISNKITKLIQSLKENFRENEKQYEVIIVFDNIEKLQISDKFLQGLLKLKQYTKFELNFIFIGLNIPYINLIQNVQLQMIPQIIKEFPNENQLAKIMINHLQNTQQNFKQLIQIFKNNEHNKLFVKNIIQTFGDNIQNLNILLSLCNQLYDVAFYDIVDNNQSQIDFYQRQKLIDQPYQIFAEKFYKEAQQMFIQNPILQFDSIDDLREGSRQFQLNQKNQKQNQDIIDIFSSHKLPKLSMIILIACWLANRNPEITDKRIFKDEKQQKPKKRKDVEGIQVAKGQDFEQKIKKVGFQRLLAIIQSIMSQQCDSYDPTQKKNSKIEIQSNEVLKYESQTFSLSMAFQQNLQYLEEAGLVTKYSNRENETMKVKFLCNLDQNIIEELSKKIGFNFQEALIG